MKHSNYLFSRFDYAIYIGAETRSKCDILVNSEARATRFDSRNYTASKYRDIATFQLIKIVHNGLVQAPIKSLDDLKLRDKDGEIITQKWLDDILLQMNGYGRLGDPENPTAVKFTGRNLQD